MTDASLWPIFAAGTFHAPDQPVLLATDQGFTLGLSVFDSLLFEGGACLFLEEHLARLEHGARGVGIPWPPPWDPRTTLYELAAKIGVEPLVLRTTLSRGAPGIGTTMVVTARAVAPPPHGGAHLWVPAARIRAEAALDGLKSTNRLRNVLAREAANRAGAWEALLVDTEARLIEGTVSNVFVRFDAELWTPPLDLGCLSGITRAQVLASLEDEPLLLASGERLRAVERATTLDELPHALEVFVTNSSGRATGALSVRGPGLVDLELPGAQGEAVRAVDGRIRRLERDYLARTRGSNASQGQAGSEPGS
ncbi:MAG: aminotransferase class IV [Planctomycetota bacterium]